MKWFSGFTFVTLLCCHVHAQQLVTWKHRLLSSGFTVGINPLNPNSVYAQSGSGTFLVSFDRGNTWQSRGNVPVGQIRQILVHPLDTTLILCAAFTGGIQRSIDYGQTWATLLPNFGIDGESIAINPAHPDTLYAGDFFTGNVYMSANRGETWVQVGTVAGNICAFIVRPDSTNILYAGAGEGRIAKTTNNGVTWRTVKPAGSLEIPKIVIDPLSPLVAYGAGYLGPDSTTGVWKTTNGGEHWFRTSLQAHSIWALDIDYSNPSTVYAGTFSEANATVFVTTNGGNVWTSLNGGIPPSSNAWSLKVHPLDPGAVWLAETGQATGIYQHLATNTLIRGVVRDAVTGDSIRNGWIINTVTRDTTRLGLTRGTFTFGRFPGDSSSTVLRVVAYPYSITDIPIVFVQDSTVALTVNVQRLATASVTGIVRDSINSQPIKARITLVASTLLGPTTLQDTTGPDGTFEFSSQYISQPPVVRYDRIEIDPAIPYRHYVVPSFTLTGTGATFPLLLPVADVLLVAGDSLRYGDYYKAALDSIGVSWNFWGQPGPAPLSKVPLFRKNSLMYYTGNRNTPFTQTEIDTLQACIARRSNLFLTGQNISENNDTTGLLRNAIGVQYAGMHGPLGNISGIPGDLFSTLSFVTTGVGGANNQTSKDRLTVTGSPTVATLRYSAPTATAAVRKDNNPGKIVFFGFGFEGISSASARKAVMQRIIGWFDGSITLGIGEELLLLPPEFALQQNYPNPFNPSTVIRYSIPHEAPVTLEVYSMLGQRVATLVENERKGAGTHEVTFTAAELSSGVYLYRIAAGSYTETRKLVVLK